MGQNGENGGILTYCYCDWAADEFRNAPMRILRGEHTDSPLRNGIRERWEEGVDYYVKRDPDFREGTYSVCHPEIRSRIEPGQFLFFRTNWRDKPYLLGGFLVGQKIPGERGPILVADEAWLRDFGIEIGPGIIEKLAPGALAERRARTFTELATYCLGHRAYLTLDGERTDYLLGLLAGDR